MARRPFHAHPNPVLVETGSYVGDGIKDALDAGFIRVISFEIAPTLHAECQARFKEDARVTCVLGSSADLLYDTIKDIQTPITFWLDGHYSYGRTSYDPKYICPLLKELEQIGRHRSDHTILIDDRRLFRLVGHNGPDAYFNVEEASVRAALLSINDQYQISYANGHVTDDVIVAVPPTH